MVTLVSSSLPHPETESRGAACRSISLFRMTTISGGGGRWPLVSRTFASSLAPLCRTCHFTFGLALTSAMRHSLPQVTTHPGGPGYEIVPHRGPLVQCRPHDIDTPTPEV